MSDPINYHPHSRFTLHEKAQLFPFRDLIWGKTDGPFFDLKVDFPDPKNVYADGTAYLQVEDVVEMAHCLGMITREEAEAKDQRIAELEIQLMRLPNEVKEFEDGLSNLTSGFLARLSERASLVSMVKEAERETEQDHSTGEPEVLPAAEQDSGGPERDSEPVDESDSSEGPDDVPSSTSDNPFAGLLD